jgi:CheY-like chemotaxis protein
MILGADRSNCTPSTDNSAGNGSITEQSCSAKSDDIKYHVIFLDNQMPVLSGLKAIEKLREAGRRDFVVGVTGTYCKYIPVVPTLTVCQATHFWTINRNI